MFADVVYQNGDQYTQTIEDMQVGLLIFFPCFAGCIMAIIALRGCYKIPAMKSSFGYLTRYEMYLRITASSNSAAFHLFGVFFDIKFIINNSHICGLILTIVVPILVTMYFLMSINRLLAISTPMYYNRIFKLKYRRIYVALCYFVPMTYTPVFMWYYDCGYKFYHYGWVFSFKITDTCGTKFETLIHTVQTVFIIPTFISDICTLIMLVGFRKRLLTNQSEEIRKREINFGQQVVLQGVGSVLYVYIYNNAYKLMPGNIPEQWKIFWTSSFYGSLLHVLSVGMIFVFNAEYFKWLFSAREVQVASISVVRPIV